MRLPQIEKFVLIVSKSKGMNNFQTNNNLPKNNHFLSLLVYTFP